MAWGKNGTPDTLTASNANMNVSDLGGSKFNVVLSHTKRATGTPYTTLYLNNDNSNNSYSRRQSENAGNDGTAVDQNTVIYDMGGDDADKFEITYIFGISSAEKLAIKDFEKQEIANMVRSSFRLAIQDLSAGGRVSKAVVEYWEQLGIHPQLAETRTRSYLVLIQEKINSF